MRKDLIENVVRNITHKVVRSLCEAASPDTSNATPIMSAERFDEILRSNGVDSDEINSMLGFEWDDVYEIDDEYTPELRLDFDDFIVSVCESADFNNFISGLTTVSEEEKEQILDGFVDVDNSQVFSRAYDILVDGCYDDARDAAEDGRQYHNDPYAYYGVRREDFF